MLTDDRIWDLWNAQGVDDMSRAEAFQFARAIEALVRKEDEALIRQMLEALENSSDLVFKNPGKADARDEAITAARARLIDSDLTKLTERGAKAWAGVDPQKLREGGAP